MLSRPEQLLPVAFAGLTSMSLLLSCNPVEHEVGIELHSARPTAGADQGPPSECDPAGCELELVWLYTVSGSGAQFGRRVALDGEGSLYFAGEYFGVAQLADEKIDSSGARSNAFLTRLTEAGSPRWLLNIGSLNEQRVNALALSAGEPVLSLEYTNGFSIAGLNVPDGTNGALALVAFDAEGQGRWSQTLHNADQFPLEPVTGPALLAMPDGSLLVAGNHEQPISIDTQSLPAPPEGQPFGFVMGLDSQSSVRWLKGTGGRQRWNAAATIATGTVLVGEATGAGGSDILLSWLNADGDTLLTRRFGDVGEDAALSVVVGDGDVVYVTGYVSSSLSLGGATLSHSGLKDVFVASYAADGSHNWSKTFGSTSDDWGVAARFAADGGLVLIGMQGDAVNFGSGLVGAFANAFFIATLGSEGTTSSARAIAMNNGQATDLAIAADGALYVAGYFDGALKVGGRTFTSSTGTDGFLIKLGLR